MPLDGLEKKHHNFVYPRIQKQKEFWPEFVEKWDEQANGARFRSEILSLTDLWRLYVGGAPEELSEEEEARGRKPPKKKDKGFEVVPIKARTLPGRFNDEGYLNFDQWLYARDQSRKDLYWLGKEVFRHDFEPHVHQVVCDQFVQKNFDGIYKEGYSLKSFQDAMKVQTRVPRVWMQTREYEKNTLGDFGQYIPDPVQNDKIANKARTMILLDPRGFFKSTIDALDAAQWIINAPDIRILIMGGVYKLALQFLVGIKNRFYLPRGQRPQPFHLLFPEFVLRGVDGDSKEPMTVTNRVHDSLDPTLGVISIGSSLSGFHCDILKFDDIVTDENCNTAETRESLLQKADGAVNLLMPWGWHDVIGTRYFPDDYYGVTKAKYDENPTEFNLKFFKRACWSVKSGYEDVERNSLFDLTEEMVELTFPEHAPFKHLRSLLRKNERSFRCQQLNQPVWGEDNSIHFPRELLLSRIKSPMEVQSRPGEVVGAIDTAREDKAHSDFTALVVAKIYRDTPINVAGFQNPAEMLLNPYGLLTSEDGQPKEGKIVLAIMDVQFGRWSQTEIANRVAAMHNQWRPTKWVGEDSGGLELLQEKIREVSRNTYGHWPNIYWMQPENSYGAKRNRIKGLETLLRDNRMFFVNAGWNTEVFDQFEKYTGQKSTRFTKDDVPDATSFLTRFLPRGTPMTQRELEQQSAQKEHEYRQWLLREHRKIVFGEDTGGFGASQFVSFGQEIPEEPDNSPMGDISKRFFGGNGLRA